MKSLSTRIFSGLALLLLLLGGVTACADRPMNDTHTERQGGNSGGGGMGGGSSGGSSGGGGGRY